LEREEGKRTQKETKEKGIKKGGKEEKGGLEENGRGRGRKGPPILLFG